MSKTPGGWSSINYSFRVAREVGSVSFVASIKSKNTCKVCAYGMGGQKGGMVNEAGEKLEICKKSMQAQLTDIQPGIPKPFFSDNSIEKLKNLSGRELERLGRLNDPLFKSKGDTHYRVISWNEALQKSVTGFKATKPDRSFFYASGRSSNEAAFILHLFARLYGTNNVNNCSYYCHQASGVAMSGMLGTGTGTIQLDDLKNSDLIFVIGANPASNHPRFLTELMHCRKRGGKVIVINPAKEKGLVRFSIPSSVQSMLKGGSSLATVYLQPHIGGDIALFTGIAKSLLEHSYQDNDFIDQFTTGFDAYRQDIEQTSWPDIVASSGIEKHEIENVARTYAESSNAVFTWAMGITHHLHGVENVESIVNLALLEGMVGRRNAGLLPLRGHSNVQGVGSMGVTPQLKQSIFEKIEKHLGVKLPTTKGWDTMTCMHEALKGNVDVAFLLGGNLYASNPDLVAAEKSLNNIPFKIYANTTLNLGHVFGSDGDMLILPVSARDEEHQPTTQESMFNFVRLSDGGIKRLTNVQSEVDVIAELASRVLGNHPVNFANFKNHNSIREAIAETIPGFNKIADISKTKEEFHIEGRTFHQPEFSTPDKKASFKIVSIPSIPNTSTYPFKLMSVRSEGQFNTIVYEEEDLWRDQTERRVVLMNADDINALGLKVNDLVTLESETGKMTGVKVREFDIKRGNVLGYYPETNTLVSAKTDSRSLTPAFKNTPILIRPE